MKIFIMIIFAVWMAVVSNLLGINVTDNSVKYVFLNFPAILIFNYFLFTRGD